MIGELAALGAAISWAIAPLLYRKALQNTKPLSANIVRCVTNAAVLVAVLVAFGLWGVLASLPLWVVAVTVISGFLGFGVGDTLYMYGLKAIGVSRAVPLVSSYPLFSLVWAVFLLGRPLSLTALVGAAVILGGIWLLSTQKIPDETAVRGRKVWLGVAMCLVTAFAWSVSVTTMDVAMTSVAVDGLGANYAVVTVRIAAMALLLLAISPLIDRDHGFLKITRQTLVLLCIGGLVANGLGWFLMNYSFLQIDPSRAIPISSTSPLFAAIAGFLCLGEKASLKTISGAVAVVAGIVLIFIL